MCQRVYLPIFINFILVILRIVSAVQVAVNPICFNNEYLDYKSFTTASYNKRGNLCSQCSDTCAKCWTTSDSGCQYCSHNSILEDSETFSCKLNCKTGEFASDQICLKCPRYCDSCRNDSLCDKCQSKFSLSPDKQSCVSDCSTNQQYNQENSCVFQCEPDYLLNSQNFVCEQLVSCTSAIVNLQKIQCQDNLTADGSLNNIRPLATVGNSFLLESKNSVLLIEKSKFNQFFEIKKNYLDFVFVDLVFNKSIIIFSENQLSHYSVNTGQEIGNLQIKPAEPLQPNFDQIHHISFASQFGRLINQKLNGQLEILFIQDYQVRNYSLERMDTNSLAQQQYSDLNGAFIMGMIVEQIAQNYLYILTDTNYIETWNISAFNQPISNITTNPLLSNHTCRQSFATQNGKIERLIKLVDQESGIVIINYYSNLQVDSGEIRQINFLNCQAQSTLIKVPRKIVDARIQINEFDNLQKDSFYSMQYQTYDYSTKSFSVENLLIKTSLLPSSNSIIVNFIGSLKQPSINNWSFLFSSLQGQFLAVNFDRTEINFLNFDNDKFISTQSITFKPFQLTGLPMTAVIEMDSLILINGMQTFLQVNINSKLVEYVYSCDSGIFPSYSLIQQEQSAEIVPSSSRLYFLNIIKDTVTSIIMRRSDREQENNQVLSIQLQSIYKKIIIDEKEADQLQGQMFVLHEDSSISGFTYPDSLLIKNIPFSETTHVQPIKFIFAGLTDRFLSINDQEIVFYASNRISTANYLKVQQKVLFPSISASQQLLAVTYDEFNKLFIFLRKEDIQIFDMEISVVVGKISMSFDINSKYSIDLISSDLSSMYFKASQIQDPEASSPSTVFSLFQMIISTKSTQAVFSQLDGPHMIVYSSQFLLFYDQTTNTLNQYTYYDAVLVNQISFPDTVQYKNRLFVRFLDLAPNKVFVLIREKNIYFYDVETLTEILQDTHLFVIRDIVLTGDVMVIRYLPESSVIGVVATTLFSSHYSKSDAFEYRQASVQITTDSPIGYLWRAFYPNLYRTESQVEIKNYGIALFQNRNFAIPSSADVFQRIVKTAVASELIQSEANKSLRTFDSDEKIALITGGSRNLQFFDYEESLLVKQNIQLSDLQNLVGDDRVDITESQINLKYDAAFFILGSRFVVYCKLVNAVLDYTWNQSNDPCKKIYQPTQNQDVSRLQANSDYSKIIVKVGSSNLVVLDSKSVIFTINNENRIIYDYVVIPIMNEIAVLFSSNLMATFSLIDGIQTGGHFYKTQTQNAIYFSISKSLLFVFSQGNEQPLKFQQQETVFQVNGKKKLERIYVDSKLTTESLQISKLSFQSDIYFGFLGKSIFYVDLANDDYSLKRLVGIPETFNQELMQVEYFQQFQIFVKVYLKEIELQSIIDSSKAFYTMESDIIGVSFDQYFDILFIFLKEKIIFTKLVSPIKFEIDDNKPFIFKESEIGQFQWYHDQQNSEIIIDFNINLDSKTHTFGTYQYHQYLDILKQHDQIDFLREGANKRGIFKFSSSSNHLFYSWGPYLYFSSNQILDTQKIDFALSPSLNEGSMQVLQFMVSESKQQVYIHTIEKIIIFGTENQVEIGKVDYSFRTVLFFELDEIFVGLNLKSQLKIIPLQTLVLQQSNINYPSISQTISSQVHNHVILVNNLVEVYVLKISKRKIVQTPISKLSPTTYKIIQIQLFGSDEFLVIDQGRLLTIYDYSSAGIGNSLYALQRPVSFSSSDLLFDFSNLLIFVNSPGYNIVVLKIFQKIQAQKYEISFMKEINTYGCVAKFQVDSVETEMLITYNNEIVQIYGLNDLQLRDKIRNKQFLEGVTDVVLLTINLAVVTKKRSIIVIERVAENGSLAHISWRLRSEILLTNSFVFYIELKQAIFNVYFKSNSFIDRLQINQYPHTAKNGIQGCSITIKEFRDIFEVNALVNQQQFFANQTLRSNIFFKNNDQLVIPSTLSDKTSFTTNNVSLELILSGANYIVSYEGQFSTDIPRIRLLQISNFSSIKLNNPNFGADPKSQILNMGILNSTFDCLKNQTQLSFNNFQNLTIKNIKFTNISQYIQSTFMDFSDIDNLNIDSLALNNVSLNSSVLMSFQNIKSMLINNISIKNSLLFNGSSLFSFKNITDLYLYNILIDGCSSIDTILSSNISSARRNLLQSPLLQNFLLKMSFVWKTDIQNATFTNIFNVSNTMSQLLQLDFDGDEDDQQVSRSLGQSKLQMRNITSEYIHSGEQPFFFLNVQEINLEQLNFFNMTCLNSGCGFAIQDSDVVIIDNSKFSMINSKASGSALYLENCLDDQKLNYVLNSIFETNTARDVGGAIFLNKSSINFFSTKFTNNTARIGGAVYYKDLVPAFIQNYEKVKNEIIFLNNSARYFGRNFGSFLKDIRISDFLAKTTNNVSVIRNQQAFDLFIEFIDEENNTAIVYDDSDGQASDMVLQQLIQNNLVIQSTDKNLLLLTKNEVNLNQFNRALQWVQIENIILNSPDDYVSSILVTSASKQNGFEIKKSYPLWSQKCVVGQVRIPYTSLANSSELFQCFPCQRGNYSLSDPYSQSTASCTQCPKGTIFCQRNTMIIKNNFWRQQNSENIYECVRGRFNCISEDPNSVKYCQSGHIGPLCQACDVYGKIWNKTYTSALDSSCKLCDDVVSETIGNFIGVYFLNCGIMILFIILYIQQSIRMSVSRYLRFSGMLLIGSSADTQYLGSFYFKNFIDLMQFSTLFGYLGVQEDSSYLSYIRLIGNPTDYKVYQIECFIQNWFPENNIPSVYTSLIFSILLLIMYSIPLGGIGYFLVRKQIFHPNIVIYNIINVIMIYMSPGFIKNCISLFMCQQFDDRYYVSENLAYECEGVIYYAFNFVMSIPIFICWIFIFPTLAYKNLQEITLQEQLQNGFYRMKYGLFLNQYKSNFYFWELVKITFKAVLVCVLYFFQSQIVIKSIFLLGIFMIYTITSLRWNPNINQRIYLFELFTNIIVFLMLLLYTSSLISENSNTIIFCSVLVSILLVTHIGFIIYLSNSEIILKFCQKIKERIGSQIKGEIFIDFDSDIEFKHAFRHWRIIKQKFFPYYSEYRKNQANKNVWRVYKKYLDQERLLGEPYILGPDIFSQRMIQNEIIEQQHRSHPKNSINQNSAQMYQQDDLITPPSQQYTLQSPMVSQRNNLIENQKYSPNTQFKNNIKNQHEIQNNFTQEELIPSGLTPKVSLKKGSSIHDFSRPSNTDSQKSQEIMIDNLVIKNPDDTDQNKLAQQVRSFSVKDNKSKFDIKTDSLQEKDDVSNEKQLESISVVNSNQSGSQSPILQQQLKLNNYPVVKIQDEKLITIDENGMYTNRSQKIETPQSNDDSNENLKQKNQEKLQSPKTQLIHQQSFQSYTSRASEQQYEIDSYSSGSPEQSQFDLDRMSKIQSNPLEAQKNLQN